jgi:hypothetical protein
VFGNKYLKQGLPLSLERQCGLDIQVPAIPIQRRHYRDTRLLRDPSALLVALAIQEVYIGLVLDT